MKVTPFHPEIRILAALGLAAVLMLATAGCNGGAHRASGDSTPPPVVRAGLATAERTEIARTVEIQGTVEADRSSAVSTRVMAQVTAIHVAAGDTVRRGQVLLEIDPQAAQGQLSQARGALAQARAQLSLTERNFHRFEELRKTDAASELELDQARTGYQQAQGAVEQAEGAVAAAASVASDSTVRAPYAGRVVRRRVEVGDLAAPGRPLLEIQSGDSRRLALAVPESVVVAGSLAPGDTLPVEIGILPELGRFDGRVVEMTPGADRASHTFEVKVALPVADASHQVPTGVAGRAWLRTGVHTAITVPKDAVLTQGGMSLVVVRGDDGTAHTRVVTLGETTASPAGPRAEILSGLDGGETVLVGLSTVPPTGAQVEEVAGQDAPRAPEASEVAL